jgi:hypothetical protein
MKNKPLVYVAVVAALFSACTPESDPKSTQKSKIAFEVVQPGWETIPDGVGVVFSLQSETGEEIYSSQYVDIEQKGNSLVSELIEVPLGAYEVTEFMIVDSEDVVFAAPKQGSPLAADVSTPVSHSISVNAAQQTVQMEVLSSIGKDSRKFGYDSFKKPARGNTWSVGLYIEENGELVLTSGNVGFTRPDGSSVGYWVEAEITSFVFESWEDRDAEYVLTASKPGYVVESTSFIFNKIPAQGRKPFKFVLEKEIIPTEFTMHPTGGSRTIDFRLGFRGTGSVTLNYSDGVSEVVAFTPTAGSDTSSVLIHHDYVLEPGQWESMKVTGDLDKIMAVNSMSVYLDRINVTALPNLENLRLYGVVLYLLDLSQNTKLTHLTFDGAQFDVFTLGNCPNLKTIQTKYMWPKEINLLVPELYRNTVANNITGGTLYVHVDEFYEPVSAEAQQYMDELRDTYGWTVVKVEY